MDYPYWKKQANNEKLFPEIEWNKPQQKQMAGHLAVIGGNKLGFSAVANSYQTALSYGAGEAKLLMPEVLKPLMPKDISDISFAPNNVAGSFNNMAEVELKEIGGWATTVLFIGDSSKNSETGLLFSEFIATYEKPTIITRDAIDLLLQDMTNILQKENTTLIVSLAQLQKIFRTTYYPKMITFNMQLNNLVETLHKFTLTYPITIVTYHAEKVIVAHNGEIVTADVANPMSLWSGEFAVKASCQIMWSPSKPLEAITSAIAS